ncbi:hypothetical protein M1N24_03155 [Dehalococcoidia bacterium]|nr:hypothetical protein [Dehalococcoidia bacterium]
MPLLPQQLTEPGVAVDIGLVKVGGRKLLGVDVLLGVGVGTGVGVGMGGIGVGLFVFVAVGAGVGVATGVEVRVGEGGR